jgi:L-fuculose-phosphate aldolase
MPMESMHAEIRQTLVWAGKVLVAEGQDDFTRGHISFRLPDNPSLFFMKPHSIGLDELTVDNILTIDLEGRVVAGTGRRHSEVYIHSEIFKARPDVHCVLHTHPPYSIALSASRRALVIYSQPAALFHHSLSIFEDTINLIRSEAMGAAVARTLGANRAVLLKHHGAVTVGATIAETVIGMIMLENAAMIQMITEAAGETRPQFPDADIEKLKHDISRPEQFDINFDYLVRRIRRKA